MVLSKVVTTLVFEAISNQTTYAPVGMDVLPSSTPEPRPSPVIASSASQKPHAFIVIVGILLGTIVVLIGLFLYLILPAVLARLRAMMPVNEKRVQARYETIEGWLITKVSQDIDQKRRC
jgi:hypothetical protein